MNVASLDLCKELCELSGWDDTALDYGMYKGKWTAGMFDENSGELIPAYDLGHLLRKLPQEYDDGSLSLTTADKNTWCIGYRNFGDWELEIFADTPEDAACLLAIKLFKEGVISHEDH